MKTFDSTASRRLLAALCLGVCLGSYLSGAQASSHREAPFITTQPKVDAADFYMFNSYEGVAADGTGGRAGFVTLIANYLPLQDGYGGPNYFSLDPNALYEIHIDNNGDAREDITFQFKFKNTLKSIALPINSKSVPIPIIQAGVVSAPNAAALNLNESFSVNIIRGDRRSGLSAALTHVGNGSPVFDKPVDNIGSKTIPDYPGYAAQHVHEVNIPGCATPGRVFVGQRKDPFAVNLGVIFDLVNAPLGVITDPSLINAGKDDLADKNVTELAIEVAAGCLVADATHPVIGGWTSASLRQGQYLTPSPAKGHGTTVIPGGGWTQVSRLGMPLVNEVVIGLPDKDRFNSSSPKDDLQFADYVTNPTLPALIEVAFGQAAGAFAPSNAGRNDLATTFLTGIHGVNQLSMITPSEMQRLNTSIPAVPFANQNRLGIVGSILAGGSDFAGYPNGRRPKDDVVDISLIAMMGGLCMANGNANALGFGASCKPAAVPLGGTAFSLHDAVDQGTRPLMPAFPYLDTPIPGAK
ncbi:MAG: DUF4331 domain-containing protein [Burkholderiaceae bacterium]|nr:DUF4331 domain-containing protein [Burkholderiaceae bacterium]